MTKNKTREGPLPPADKGVNDARPALPTPTVRRNVTWVQPEPTTSDATRPQQLSPDTTWAEPSVAKSKLAKGSPGSQPTGTNPRNIRQSDGPIQIHLLVH